MFDTQFVAYATITSLICTLYMSITMTMYFVMVNAKLFKQAKKKINKILHVILSKINCRKCNKYHSTENRIYFSNRHVTFKKRLVYTLNISSILIFQMVTSTFDTIFEWAQRSVRKRHNMYIFTYVFIEFDKVIV